MGRKSVADGCAAQVCTQTAVGIPIPNWNPSLLNTDWDTSPLVFHKKSRNSFEKRKSNRKYFLFWAITWALISRKSGYDTKELPVLYICLRVFPTGLIPNDNRVLRIIRWMNALECSRLTIGLVVSCREHRIPDRVSHKTDARIARVLWGESTA